MKSNKKTYSQSTKSNSVETHSVRTDLDTEHPYDTVDRYAGDSVNEHKSMEQANEYIADKELGQINENS